MKTETQWYVTSGTDGIENQGDYDSQEQAKEAAMRESYPYVEERTLTIGSDDEIVSFRSNYYQVTERGAGV
jgi:hypothetical protein